LYVLFFPVIICLFGKAWIIINLLLTIYKTRLYSSTIVCWLLFFSSVEWRNGQDGGPCWLLSLFDWDIISIYRIFIECTRKFHVCSNNNNSL
jgi:hypothetical protein